MGPMAAPLLMTEWTKANYPRHAVREKPAALRIGTPAGTRQTARATRAEVEKREAE
jgi:hypothetical protein